MECHSKWKVNKNGKSLKMECHLPYISLILHFFLNIKINLQKKSTIHERNSLPKKPRFEKQAHTKSNLSPLLAAALLSENHFNEKCLKIKAKGLHDAAFKCVHRDSEEAVWALCCSLVEPLQLLFLMLDGHIWTWTGPTKIFKNLDRASPCLNVYIKKIKKLYEPTSLHLEPSNAFVQQVEWSGAGIF